MPPEIGAKWQTYNNSLKMVSQTGGDIDLFPLPQFIVIKPVNVSTLLNFFHATLYYLTTCC